MTQARTVFFIRDRDSGAFCHNAKFRHFGDFSDCEVFVDKKKALKAIAKLNYDRDRGIHTLWHLNQVYRSHVAGHPSITDVTVWSLELVEHTITING